jgi:hypothetical protein
VTETPPAPAPVDTPKPKPAPTPAKAVPVKTAPVKKPEPKPAPVAKPLAKASDRTLPPIGGNEVIVDPVNPVPCAGSLVPAKRGGRDVLICKKD